MAATFGVIKISFLCQIIALFISCHLAFFSCKCPLQKIDKFRALYDELALLRQTAYLNLFSLDCKELNLLLAKRAMDLAERLVAALVIKNRDLNKGYAPYSNENGPSQSAHLFIFSFSLCDRYDNISNKVYEDPQSTQEMVELVQFLTKVSDLQQ